MTILKKYKEDIAHLKETGNELIKNIGNEKFILEYEIWYTEAMELIKFVLPNRIEDFKSFYEKNKNRKIITSENYQITDYITGCVKMPTFMDTNYQPQPIFQKEAVVKRKFRNQLSILLATEKRFESSLFDIRQLVQADIFDSELDSAKELLKKKFYRASGVIAGAVLEKHLAEVCKNHSIPIQKRNPTIGDLNELLKSEGIIEIPTWRNIQHLADIRNICGHNKEEEPKQEEIKGIIDGTDKIIKTIF